MPINFLQKYEQLKKSVPIPAVRVTQIENCEMVDYTHFSKHCYQTFVVMASENILYSTLSVGKNLVDCELCIFSELCYGCIQTSNSYGCSFTEDCDHCQDCHFCIGCNNCQNCFGCVALTNKQYCFFNKQYTQIEYGQKLQAAKKEAVAANHKKIKALFITIPQPQSRQHNNKNCPYGDYLNNSKNVYWGFNTFFAEDSGYLFNCGTIRNSWDNTFTGGGGSGTNNITAITDELVYGMVGGANNYACSFSEYLNYCRDCHYCASCQNCQDCFGCAGLSKKQYCVFNNQLTKEEYEKAVSEIKKELGWKIV
ncbi:hypothetical protein GYA19_02520 [Candidatus Beckwithbacteria bacterium]|nr:hypothetical protein [Candidatus Beckwithbacteria bacterium]